MANNLLYPRAKRPVLIAALALFLLVGCVFVSRNIYPASSRRLADPLNRHLMSVNSSKGTPKPLVANSSQQHHELGTPFINLIQSQHTSEDFIPQRTQTSVSPDKPLIQQNIDAGRTVSTKALPSPITVPPPSPTAPPLPSFHFSKDLFVRAVYFDSRPRDGHQNVSVFLVVCVRNITDDNLITGCVVDGVPAKDYSVKLIGETPLWRAFYNYINHEEVLVHCYDLPARNGSTAHIAYRANKKTDVVTLAASERPLFIPAPRITPTSEEGRKYDLTVVACAKVFNRPPWLKEWLTYQKTLGIDHVHLDAEDSFVNNGGMNQDYIREMMAEGFLSVDIWKRYLNGGEIWYHNQGLIYEDCPYRFMGTYDYIVMMDTDDFFTPRVPTEKKIHYYISRYCMDKTIGSCKFRWVEYYPDSYGMDKNISTEDGNMTKALKSYTHYNQGNPKSLHRTTVLIDTATHYAYKMMPGFRIFNVPVSVAYVAHVRLYKKAGQGLVEGLPSTCSEHVLSKQLLFAALCFVFFVSPFFIHVWT